MNRPKKPEERSPSTPRTYNRVSKVKKANRKVSSPLPGLSIPDSSFSGTQAYVFWAFVEQTEQKTESDRIEDIRKGFPIKLSAALHDALKITFPVVAELLNTSTSTLKRRMRSEQPMDVIASERLDRIAQITGMAEDVLKSREETARWLTRAHPALGQQAPISFCGTEIGAHQVRRILSSMDWGNVV